MNHLRELLPPSGHCVAHPWRYHHAVKYYSSVHCNPYYRLWHESRIYVRDDMVVVIFDKTFLLDAPFLGRKRGVLWVDRYILVLGVAGCHGGVCLRWLASEAQVRGYLLLLLHYLQPSISTIPYHYWIDYPLLLLLLSLLLDYFFYIQCITPHHCDMLPTATVEVWTACCCTATEYSFLSTTTTDQLHPPYHDASMVIERLPLLPSATTTYHCPPPIMNHCPSFLP